MKNAKLSRLGFTLVELLVVVLIIGILAAVAVPQYQKAVIKARYAGIKNLTNSLLQAEQVYYMENGTFTDNLENLDITLSGGAFDESTPKKYVYKWGYCDAVNSETSVKVDIHCMNDDIKMGYVVGLTVSKANKDCIVYGSNKETDYPMQNLVCQAETQLAKRSGTSLGSETFPAYVRWRY